MATSRVNSFAAANGVLPANERSAVEAALEVILQSQPFRTSKQCQDLLRYMVEHSLRDDDGSLRERVIGAAVFGRSPSYDTSEDPVVRVRAADVRKRLAQYYQKATPKQARIRIDVLPGSYRALFCGTAEEVEERVLDHPVPVTPAFALPEGRDQSPAEPIPLTAPLRPQTADAQLSRAANQKHLLVRRGYLGLLVALAVLLSGLLYRTGMPFLHPDRTPLAAFWLPVTASSRPALLTVGANAAYRFSAEFLEHYRQVHHMQNTGPEFFVNLPPDASVHASDLVPVMNTFVTVGDVAASAQIASLLTRDKKPYDLRYAADLSFADLRNVPVILIGGFNNNWTMQLTSDLPFVLDGGETIRETGGQKRSWVTTRQANGSVRDDYALISRIPKSKTGAMVITVAGIGQFGTQAAGEFLTTGEKVA